MAFLAVDDRPRFRRFAHSQLQYHFLAEVTVGLLSHGEVPKYIRRNILGPDFLITFSDVVAANGGDTHNGIHTFVRSASDLAHHYLSADRGSRNLAAILIAALPVAEQSPVLQIEGLEIDDAVIKGTAAEAEIIRCTINQLDARAADISNVKFDHTQIVNLIGDNGTRLSSSFPDTYAIQDETPGTEAGILNPDGIREWLDIHGRAATNESGVLGDLSSAAFQNHPLYRLLGRACRYKAYWIRSDESDIIADRILNDPWWSELEETLDRHGLIRKEYRHASGRASQFFHIKRKTDLLDPELGDSQIAAVFKELKEIAERMASRSASP